MVDNGTPGVNRRRYLQGVTAAALAGVAGCLSGDGGGEQSQLEDPIELYTWNLPFLEESIEDGWLTDFEEEFSDEYENLDTEWIDRGPSTEEIISFFESRLQAGDPPHIFDTQVGAYARYADQDVFAPMEDFADEEFLSKYDETAIELNRFDGTLYQMPFYMGTNMTAYRTQWFDEAGVEPPTFDNPWTTDEYFDAAEQIVDGSDADFGLTFIRFDYLLWPWFQSEGIEVVNDDGTEAAFNETRTVEILKRFRELTDDGVIPEVSWTGDWQPAAEQFGSGNTGMYFGSGSALRLIQNFGGDWVDNDSMGIAHAPDGGGLFTYHGLGLVSTGRSQREMEAAFDLIRVILNKKWQRDFLERTTVLVPHSEALNELRTDDEFREENPLLVQLYDMYEVVSDDLWRVPTIPESTQVAEIIDTEFSAAALGEKDPETAVEQAESRVNSALQ